MGMFNPTAQQQGGGGSAVSVKNTNSGGDAFAAVSRGVSELGSIFKQHQSNQAASAKQEASEQASATSRELSDGMSMIQLQVDQGIIKQGDANMKGRALYSRMVKDGADPVDLKKTWDAAKGVYGGFEKTTEEKAIEKNKENAILNGEAFGHETPEVMRDILVPAAGT